MQIKICDNTYILDATAKPFVYEGKDLFSRAYAVHGQNGVALVDTGFPGFGDDILTEVAQVGTLECILLTHSDLDHMGNAAFIQDKTGCSVYISELELPYVTGEMQRQPNKQKMIEDMGLTVPKLSTYQNYVPERFTVIPTPGHTPGHVCLLCDDALFVGDACSFIGGVFAGANPIWTLDIEQARASLVSLAPYRFLWICPAHGEPVKRGNYL